MTKGHIVNQKFNNASNEVSSGHCKIKLKSAGLTQNTALNYIFDILKQSAKPQNQFTTRFLSLLNASEDFTII